jgi:hypothetical protein
MLVRELIELLSKLDGDKVVMMEQNGGEYVSDLDNLKVVDGDERVWLLD